VTLSNPLSVVKALERNQIEDYWVDTGTAIGRITSLKLMNNAGRNASITQRLWRASKKFRGDFDRLITQESIKLEVDEQINFKTCCLCTFVETSFIS
jgi:hypothetical protein